MPKIHINIGVMLIMSGLAAAQSSSSAAKTSVDVINPVKLKTAFIEDGAAADSKYGHGVTVRGYAFDVLYGGAQIRFDNDRSDRHIIFATPIGTMSFPSNLARKNVTLRCQGAVYMSNAGEDFLKLEGCSPIG